MSTANPSVPQPQSLPRNHGLLHGVRESIANLGELVMRWITTFGDMALFSGRTIRWMFTRLPRKDILMPNFYQIGVLSLPVVSLTGVFIGMVLAVQSYTQFRQMRLETRLARSSTNRWCASWGQCWPQQCWPAAWVAPLPPSLAQCA